MCQLPRLDICPVLTSLLSARCPFRKKKVREALSSIPNVVLTFLSVTRELMEVVTLMGFRSSKMQMFSLQPSLP